MAPQFSATRQEAIAAFALANALPRGPLPAAAGRRHPVRHPADDVAGAVSAAQAPPVPTAAIRAGALAAFWPGCCRLAGQRAVRAAHRRQPPTRTPTWRRCWAWTPARWTYRGRRVIGDDLLWNLLVFAIPARRRRSGGPSTWHAAGRCSTSLRADAWDPRVIHTSMGQRQLPGALLERAGRAAVGDATRSPRTPPSTARRSTTSSGWRTAAMDDVWAENYPGPKPTSILYRVLRQSMLREYVTPGRARPRSAPGCWPPSALREVELVNVDRRGADHHRGRDHAAPVRAGVTAHLGAVPGRPASRRRSPRSPSWPTCAPAWTGSPCCPPRNSTGCSPRRSTPAATGSTSGSPRSARRCWPTSSDRGRRQDRRRQRRRRALHLGAYGWVENVRPAAARAGRHRSRGGSRDPAGPARRSSA